MSASNESAFPRRYMRGPDDHPGQGIQQAPGMTLRDYFAAKALVSYIFPEILHGANTEEEINLEFTNCAAFAYRMADAMLAERAK